MEKTASARLSQLTWMRFPAALIVIFFHLGAGVSFIDDSFWSSVTRNGPVAVSFFFTLSGFIMASVYPDIRIEGVGLYWVSRFARIYPLYVMTLLWFIATHHEWGWPDLYLNLTLMQAWIPGHALSLNSVGWSLSVEAAFYAVFPALMIAGRFLGLRMFATIVGCIWLTTQIAVYVLAASLHPVYPSANHDLVTYFPVFHINSFLVGMLAAMIARRVNLPSRLAGLIACASLIVAAMILLYRLAPPRLPHLGLLSPFFAVAIFAMANVNSKLMRSRIAIFCGETSYALFIGQIAIAEAVWKFWIPLAPMTDEKFWPLLALLLFTSFVTFVLVERPLRGLIKKMFSPKMRNSTSWRVTASLRRAAAAVRRRRWRLA